MASSIHQNEPLFLFQCVNHPNLQKKESNYRNSNQKKFFVTKNHSISNNYFEWQLQQQQRNMQENGNEIKNDSYHFLGISIVNKHSHHLYEIPKKKKDKMKMDITNITHINENKYWQNIKIQGFQNKYRNHIPILRRFASFFFFEFFFFRIFFVCVFIFFFF